MDPDWRIAPIKRLHGQRFRLKNYYPPSSAWEHDHCAVCWAKFMLAEDCLNRGYAISAEYTHGEDSEWLCEECFRDLHKVMAWKAIE
jgi:hypothetical protein